MEKMNPNLKAQEKLGELSTRLGDADDGLTAAREAALEAIATFNSIREKRNKAFEAGFSHIAAQIDSVYKQLTNNFGVAHLTADASDEPYLKGIRYSVLPKSKTFRDFKDLSGGEKSMASLALLFAIHSYKASPFIILDEVDAALDAENGEIVARYFRRRSLDTQLVVVSHKENCYSKADALIGVYADLDADCSRTLSLDLSPYPM